MGLFFEFVSETKMNFVCNLLIIHPFIKEKIVEFNSLILNLG
jgi:hypothetical protein